MGSRWLNRDAVEWVIHEVEVPGGLFSTLVVVASFTDKEGRGARPAQQTVAYLSGRSLRKVVADLAALVQDKHLQPGDWRLVASIRADKRPNVYDLPDPYRLWITQQRRADPAHGKSDATCNPRPSDVQSTTERRAGFAHKEVLKTSGKARGGAQPPAAPRTPVDNPTRRRADNVCRECANRYDHPYHRNVCKGDRP